MKNNEPMLSRVQAVIHQEDDMFKILSFKNPYIECTLDSLGIWIWLLVDGSVSRTSLIEQILERFPEEEVTANEAIDNLIDNKLLIPSNKSNSSGLANINVYLSTGLVSSYKDSYLIWYLSHVADTVSIVTEEAQADIIFCASLENHSELPDKCYALVANDPTDDEEQKFDYIFSTREAQSPYHLKWTRFPENSIDSDLQQILKQNMNNGYAIERISKRFQTFLNGDDHIDDKPQAVASSTCEIKAPLLTIGMATYDDYDGVYFSLTSLQIHHAEIFKQSEIIILDNNPEGPAAPLLEHLAKVNTNVRYIPYSDKNSTAVRDILFTLANGKWVLCMDSHVMLPEGVLSRLYNYLEKNPNSKDLLQGPILDDSGGNRGSHFVEDWRDGMYGYWGWDERANDVDAPPFEIPMQGLGLFVCRKATWPGFNRLFTGFGGEEGYIHQKIRNQGGKCLCLPFLQWSHRFGRPYGGKYENRWIDRIQNYFIGFEEVGIDTQQVEDHFVELVNQQTVDQAKANVRQLLLSPFRIFDHIACINLDTSKQQWQKMQHRFTLLGIANRAKRFSAYATPEYHHTGTALSHRKIIEQAKLFGYRNVLVFEDDAIMLDGAKLIIDLALKEIEKIDWKILYFGATEHGKETKLVENCLYVKELPKFCGNSTHAIVYHESVYDEILEELPASEDEMAEWHGPEFAVDKYFTTIDSRYMVYPKPFTQTEILWHEVEKYQTNYYR